MRRNYILSYILENPQGKYARPSRTPWDFFIIMRYIYITLEGALGDYVKPVRTESTTKSSNLQKLQGALNAIVRAHSDQEADSTKCQELWETLVNITRESLKTQLTPEEKKSQTFSEIKAWLGGVGEALAFGATRNGISKSSMEIYRLRWFRASDDSPEFLENFLKYTVCQTSLFFRNADTAKYLLESYSDMTDSELVLEAIKEREEMGVFKKESSNDPLSFNELEKEMLRSFWYTKSPKVTEIQGIYFTRRGFVNYNVFDKYLNLALRDIREEHHSGVVCAPKQIEVDYQEYVEEKEAKIESNMVQRQRDTYKLVR